MRSPLRTYRIRNRILTFDLFEMVSISTSKFDFSIRRRACRRVDTGRRVKETIKEQGRNVDLVGNQKPKLKSKGDSKSNYLRTQRGLGWESEIEIEVERGLEIEFIFERAIEIAGKRNWNLK